PARARRRLSAGAPGLRIASWIGSLLRLDEVGALVDRVGRVRRAERTIRADAYGLELLRRDALRDEVVDDRLGPRRCRGLVLRLLGADRRRPGGLRAERHVDLDADRQLARLHVLRDLTEQLLRRRGERRRVLRERDLTALEVD